MDGLHLVLSLRFHCEWFARIDGARFIGVQTITGMLETLLEHMKALNCFQWETLELNLQDVMSYVCLIDERPGRASMTKSA
ncbi:hypothetical protein WI97_14785 [Burkholderia vietnamiensis]|nr:hypothetical protein WI97_14785 [Burkholderia vietnamiensis]